MHDILIYISRVTSKLPKLTSDPFEFFNKTCSKQSKWLLTRRSICVSQWGRYARSAQNIYLYGIMLIYLYRIMLISFYALLFACFFLLCHDLFLSIRTWKLLKTSGCPWTNRNVLKSPIDYDGKVMSYLWFTFTNHFLTRMFAKRQNVVHVGISRNTFRSNNRKNHNIEFNSTDFICNLQGTGTSFKHGPPLLIKLGFIRKGGPCMKQVPVLQRFE